MFNLMLVIDGSRISREIVVRFGLHFFNDDTRPCPQVIVDRPHWQVNAGLT